MYLLLVCRSVSVIKGRENWQRLVVLSIGGMDIRDEITGLIRVEVSRKMIS